GMWDWDIGADVLIWSDRCKKIVGVSPDATLNYGVFLDAIHPDDRERINRAVEEALDHREDYDVEMRIPWHDGTVHWAACRGRGLYDQAGKAVRMIGMAVDITERKEAVEALRVSEERLRRASRAGRIGLYEWNEDWDMVYFSPEAYELFGCDPNSPVTYEKFFERVHPDDREAFRHSSAEACEKARNVPGGSVQREFRVVHEDGTVLWLLATAMYDLEGGDVMVRGAVRDITKRKLAEMALQEKQETLEVMAEELEVQNEELRTSYEELERITWSLEQSERNLARAQAISHVGNWHIDPVTKVGSGSDEFFRVLGIPGREKLFYSEFLELVHPEDRPMTVAVFEEVKRTHQQKSFDFRIVRPDGEERYIFLDGEFAFDREGRPSMFGTMQDITERKRAEEALADAKAQAELYLDLMAHDINNFNLVARGYLELMDGMADGELKQIISKPMEAIDSSSRLILNVQKLQRAKSGGSQAEALDLGALVGEVAGQFKTLSGDMSVNIDCDVVKGVRVRANELLRDVFLNLVGNAIKHSPGPAEINIHMALEENDGRGYYRVFIDDNGPGVPDDMKEKIFDRLSRGNTKAKGSGLGLYLVRTLVDSYGGRVWVEDRIHGDHMKGARFVVMLPAVENQ
ncbi:MAG TPA: PAS domain-containing protein, partial [Methanocella sp.]|nr:PAS domain-containing protein [Methanocella sp.]